MSSFLKQIKTFFDQHKLRNRKPSTIVGGRVKVVTVYSNNVDQNREKIIVVLPDKHDENKRNVGTLTSKVVNTSLNNKKIDFLVSNNFNCCRLTLTI